MLGLPPGILRIVMPKTFRVFDEAARRTDATLRCLIASLAAERYRRRYDRWPDDLAQLVPNYVGAVPVDPFDGAPLGYQRRGDRVVIFSRCPVQAAGVGRVAYNPNELSPPGVGVAVHLFDVKHRRQPFAEIVPPPTRDDDDVP